MPLGLALPAGWPPLGQVALLACVVLLLEVVRGVLNYVYALSSGYLVHTRIVPQLRNRVDLDPTVKDVNGLPVARVTLLPRDGLPLKVRWRTTPASGGS